MNAIQKLKTIPIGSKILTKDNQIFTIIQGENSWGETCIYLLSDKFVIRDITDILYYDLPWEEEFSCNF